MRALKGRGPLLPDVRLFHNPDKAVRYMLGRDMGDCGELDDNKAYTFSRGSDVVVLMCYRGDLMEEYALLVHEAVHVVRTYFSETLMEEHAGEEVYAYATQAVAGQLMWAHDKWMRKHRGGC
jgi:hypothetical protein